MSIASAIQAAQNKVSNAYMQCASMGATIPSERNLSNLPNCIATIQGGGGGGGIPSDNWMKDGNTHLWIEIVEDYQKEQKIRLAMEGTINWGDGVTEQVSLSSVTDKSHTYQSKGKFRIDLIPTNETVFTLAGSTTANIMGTRTSGQLSDWRSAVLYQVEIGTKSITALGEYLFQYCRALGKIYIPKNITSLGTMMFVNSEIRQVVFEDSSKISQAALNNVFNGATALQKITPFNPSSVTSMDSTYRNCYVLMEAIIPSSVSTVGALAVANAFGLQKLKCLPTTPPTLNNNALTGLPSTCKIQVPVGSGNSYKAETNWSGFSSQIEEAGLISVSLTNISIDNQEVMVDYNGSYHAELTADSGYTINSVTVTMNGTDITNSAYSNGVIDIQTVTGNITINAVASQI